jgi:TonB family protein
VLPPQVLERPALDLSGVFGHARVRGLGVFEAVITRQGEVADVRVVRSLGPRADSACVAAFRKAKFRPATKDGKPVAVYFTLTVNIHLR